MIKLFLFAGIGAILFLPIVIAMGGAAVYAMFRAFRHETRFRRFFLKYKNDEVARMIAGGKIWTGQSAAELRDSKGEPLRIEAMGEDQVWIYQPTGLLNPGGMRVTVHNDRVKTWS